MFQKYVAGDDFATDAVSMKGLATFRIAAAMIFIDVWKLSRRPTGPDWQIALYPQIVLVSLSDPGSDWRRSVRLDS